MPEFQPSDIENLRESWRAIQTDFVDDPRRSAQAAHDFVLQVLDKVREQWARDDVQTEELRLTIQRYRGIFQHIMED